jgi:redox-sensitive bicupin YhaK (pirin superfamily)
MARAMTPCERIAEHLRQGGRYLLVPFHGWLRIEGFEDFDGERLIRFRSSCGRKFVVDAADRRLSRLQFAGVA